MVSLILLVVVFPRRNLNNKKKISFTFHCIFFLLSSSRANINQKSSFFPLLSNISTQFISSFHQSFIYIMVFFISVFQRKIPFIVDLTMKQSLQGNKTADEHLKDSSSTSNFFFISFIMKLNKEF